LELLQEDSWKKGLELGSRAKQQYTAVPRLCQELFWIYAKIMPRNPLTLFNKYNV